MAQVDRRRIVRRVASARGALATGTTQGVVMGMSTRWRAIAATMVAGAAWLGGAGSAQAALELRVPQPYVAAPGAATILVRSDVPGTVRLFQERPDRRYRVPGPGSAGWSCTSPGSTDRPGYIEATEPFATVAIDAPNTWVRVRVRANRLLVTNYDAINLRYDIIRALVPQPRELIEGSCADPATLYDGVFAVGAIGAPTPGCSGCSRRRASSEVVGAVPRGDQPGR